MPGTPWRVIVSRLPRDLNSNCESVHDLSLSRGSLNVKWNVIPFILCGSHHFSICLETVDKLGRTRFVAKKISFEGSGNGGC